MAAQNDKFRLLRRIPDLRFEEVPKGYSKEQVNRVLDNLAQLYEEVERLQARLAEAETRAASAEARLVEARSPSNAQGESVPPLPNADFDETLRNTLVSAQRTADTMVKDAKDEADRLQSEAELQSTAMLDEAREQSEEMTAEAVAARETKLKEAEQERLDLTAQYKSELEERKAAIESELEEAHEEERSNLLRQISDLKATHGSLQDDIGRFEEHLNSRREAIRVAIDDLNTVVEDPTSLRSAEVPEPSDVTEVDETDYEKIAIQSPELEKLESDIPEDTSDASEEVTVVEDVEDSGRSGFEVQDDSGPEEATSETTESVETTPPNPPSNGDAPQAFEEDVTLDGATLDQKDSDSSDAESSDKPSLNSGDPFLAELRRVTNEEPEDGDPITDFLEDESSASNSGGWFGRRK